MTLKDIRDWAAGTGLSEHVYMGKLPNKHDRSIGVYNSKQTHAYKIALGGHQNESYGTLFVTFLVHWSESLIETTETAKALFEALEKIRENEINGKCIKWIQLPYEIQDVGTDENGIYEQVIEAAIIYEKG